MLTCDHCPKRAVRHYQRAWHIFDITKDGDYTNERFDYDNDQKGPADENHLYLCKEHEAAFVAHEL